MQTASRRLEFPGIDHVGVQAHPVELIGPAGTANAAVGIIGKEAGAGIKVHQENRSRLGLQGKRRTPEVPHGARSGLDLELIDLVVQVSAPFRERPPATRSPGSSSGADRRSPRP